MSDARQFGEWREYDDIIAMMKARLAELNISHSTFERLTGWPAGMAGKVFGDVRGKTIGPVHLGPAFEVLAIKPVFFEDIEAAARMADRWEQRVRGDMNAMRTASVGKRTIERMVPVVLHEMQKRSMRAQSKPTRRRIAKRAAVARWRPKLSQIRRDAAMARWHPKPAPKAKSGHTKVPDEAI